jgi:hypothetical protein
MPKRKRVQRAATTLAEIADRYRLYELAVQSAPAEIDFVDATFKALRNRSPKLLREDFCGTAQVCCEWVGRRKGNRAIGVDRDDEVLEWGRRHNMGRLGAEQQGRVELLLGDVLEVETPPADLVVAMNFGYWRFKERAQLRAYFARVHAALAADGILFLDAYGGYQAVQEFTEEQVIDEGGFTYLWEQARFDPIGGGLLCYIHFSFPDGSRLERAFSYDWRLWSLPELRDLLLEVGFQRVMFYWQGYDEAGEPDGVFEPVQEGEPDAGWVCYLSAEK